MLQNNVNMVMLFFFQVINFKMLKPLELHKFLLNKKINHVNFLVLLQTSVLLRTSSLTSFNNIME